LFGDLEAQMAAERRAEAAADLAERTRAERATVRLADRIRASVGTRVRVFLGDPLVRSEAVVEGQVHDAAPEWFVMRDDTGAVVVITTRAVRAVRGLAHHAAPPPGRVESRLGLGHVLRRLARDRAGVQVLGDAGLMSGRIEAVGADHLDLTDEGRLWVVPFDALAYVRTQG